MEYGRNRLIASPDDSEPMHRILAAVTIVAMALAGCSDGGG